MMYALNQLKTERIEAEPGKKGYCEGCNEKVVAKCGEIKIWHWAHEPNSECPYSTHPETYWHRRWKEYYPINCREVIINNKRADIKTDNGLVIELQNSSISSQEIQLREQTYKNMVWIINGEHFDDNFDIREKEGYYTFRWKWPRKTWSYANSPVYIDFHGKYLFLIKKLYSKGGWGIKINKNEFIKSSIEVKL